MKRGLYRPHLRRVRLSIYHNPDAAIRLPPTFAGVHDEQWDEVELDEGSLGYGPIALAGTRGSGFGWSADGTLRRAANRRTDSVPDGGRAGPADSKFMSAGWTRAEY